MKQRRCRFDVSNCIVIAGIGNQKGKAHPYDASRVSSSPDVARQGSVRQVTAE